MSNLTERQAETRGQGTVFRQFLANRGVVMVKETRPIGKCKGDHGDMLAVETMLLTILKGAKRDTTYGVRLERHDSEGDVESSAFIDFDELDELLEAIKFIHSTANELSAQERDYTEVSYSTKDSAKFGFYQSAEIQQAFVSVSENRGTTFLTLAKLASLAKIIEKSRAHLVSRGAPE
ncbi:hypothetical protein QUA52_30365 [Microcoleus sp. N9_A3]|uniref:hypothetical protein n=1 Tax=Microcoleus sp. N9_A3 TaxID=3055382 RepID=UPI002FD0808F